MAFGLFQISAILSNTVLHDFMHFFDVKLYIYTLGIYVGLELPHSKSMHAFSFNIFKVVVPIYKPTNNICNSNHTISSPILCVQIFPFNLSNMGLYRHTIGVMSNDVEYLIICLVVILICLIKKHFLVIFPLSCYIVYIFLLFYNNLYNIYETYVRYVF